MSSVVQFLEALARNPKALSPEEFVAVIEGSNLDPVVRKALLERDAALLCRELDARGAMCCMVFPADNEEPKEGDEQRDDDETPEQQPSSKAA
jgi:hypothetical protein